MSIWRRVTGLLVGIVYGLIYTFLAVMATGGGHGNFIWLFIYIIPFIGPLVFFSVLGFLATDLRPFVSKVIFGSLLICHYSVFALLTIFADGDIAADNARTWSKYPSNIYFMVVVYLVGQLPLLAIFAKSLFIDRATDVTEEVDLSILR